VACALFAASAAACTNRSDAAAPAKRADVPTAVESVTPMARDGQRAPATPAAAPAGAAKPAGAADAGSARGDVPRAVVATAADTLLASADVYAGWRSFNVNCQSCHGFNAVASDVAPDLRNSVRERGTVTRAQFHEVVRNGRMAKGMPAWGALLDAKQIDQIYAYLRARSSGALGAGRPSVGHD